MSGHRVERMAAAIRGEIARVVLEEVSDPGLRGVVITDVRVAGDGSEATVFYDTDASGEKEADKGFTRACPFLRRRLGEELKLRHTPVLHFKLDAHTRSATRVLELIENRGFENREEV